MNGDGFDDLAIGASGAGVAGETYIVFGGPEIVPPLLAVRGSTAPLKLPPVGMVGARNASLSGIKLATKFASELAAIPYTVVSGFARGIDAAAHRAAIDGRSVAVFAGGVDAVFPPEHVEFHEEFLAQGNAIVSEMPLGWRPRAVDFPRRNRIIAGISLGVIVVEAAKRSGSLITARLANEAGRLVFAAPGSPLDPRSAGSNSLIKKGAQLALETKDIVCEIEPLLGKMGQDDLFNSLAGGYEEDHSEMVDRRSGDQEKGGHSEDIRQQITQALGPTPVEVDELVRHCQAPVAQVQLVLIELALAGKLERHPGNRISLVMDG